MLLELPLTVSSAALSLALVGSDAFAALAAPSVEPATRTFVGGLLGTASAYGLSLVAHAFEARSSRAAWLVLTIAFVCALVASLGVIASRSTGLAAYATGSLAALSAVTFVVGLWQGRTNA